MNHRRTILALLAGYGLLLTGCAVTALPSQRLTLPAQQPFAVLPFANTTDVPQVERRAQAITVSLLQQKGLRDVQVYPQAPDNNPLEAAAPVTPAQALAWARKTGASYALTGTVTEWRYKTGVDAEPAVGITLRVIDLASGQTVWSASGGRSGWGYQALAAVGQSQIADLLSGLRVVAAAPAASAAR